MDRISAALDELPYDEEKAIYVEVWAFTNATHSSSRTRGLLFQVSPAMKKDGIPNAIYFTALGGELDEVYVYMGKMTSGDPLVVRGSKRVGFVVGRSAIRSAARVLYSGMISEASQDGKGLSKRLELVTLRDMMNRDLISDYRSHSSSKVLAVIHKLRQEPR